MARTDAVVLGAGIVGTSIALHLAKRGLSVSLVDRGEPGQETSYGNAGVIEGNTVFPVPFPRDLGVLLRVALKRAPEANYHFTFLPRVAPWLLAYWMASRPRRLMEIAIAMRPLFERAVAEHEVLLTEAGAERYLRKNGWLKVYRSDRTYDAMQRELEAASKLGVAFQRLDQQASLALEPALAPVFRHGIFWPTAASVTNPLAVTRAYAQRFAAFGGVTLVGDARTLHRSGTGWRIDTAEGPLDSGNVVIALGPWAPDVLEPLGLRLPLGIKRGYHRHFRQAGGQPISRPVLDADYGYCLAPMEQGLRITTGAEFASRDAPPTPVQFDRVMPGARSLFPLGEQTETTTWLGKRPCFPDSKPAIGPAPGLPGLWLAYGHAHWGLTLGPATGRLIAEMITGATPFCDPKPYAAERFL